MTGCNFAIQPCRLCFTEDSSPSVAPEHRSLSHPRLAPGSPDSRLCRKLSPVEIYYYEMSSPQLSLKLCEVSGGGGWDVSASWNGFTLQLQLQVYTTITTYGCVVHSARVTHFQEVHPMWRAEVFQLHRCCLALHQSAFMWGNDFHDYFFWYMYIMASEVPTFT